MKNLVIVLLALSIFVCSPIAGIPIPKMPDGEVVPNASALYSYPPEIGLGGKIYDFNFSFNNVSLTDIDKKKEVTGENVVVTLEVNESNKWISVASKPYSKQMNFEVNLGNLLSPSIGTLSYRLKSENGAILTNVFKGPEIKAIFRNATSKKVPSKNLYNYMVDVRTTEPMPIDMYIKKEDGTWNFLEQPQNSGNDSNRWETLTWPNIPWFSNVEFVAKP